MLIDYVKLNMIEYFRYKNYYKNTKMDLNVLETIKINTLLNLSNVHLKNKNYKSSIGFSKQVNFR